MTPNDMNKYRKDFNRACVSLGWKRKPVKYHYEREEGYSVYVTWYDSQGKFLFREDDIAEGLLLEIMRLASLVPKAPDSRSA